ncbi:hypothetical protein AOLI_G00091080 [Acnodon oligacanthus]
MTLESRIHWDAQLALVFRVKFTQCDGGCKPHRQRLTAERRQHSKVLAKVLKSQAKADISTFVVNRNTCRGRVGLTDRTRLAANEESSCNAKGEGQKEPCRPTNHSSSPLSQIRLYDGLRPITRSQTALLTLCTLSSSPLDYHGSVYTPKA